MKCPKCGNDEDKVLDSRSAREGAAIRRRRECTACGCRFTTHEEIDRDEVSVVKRDGRRQPFDRRKLEKGVRIACGNRPVSDDQIRNLLDDVISSIDSDEISSEKLGESVMERLNKMDQVSYIRFASVYRNFTDVNQFLSAVTEMVNRR
jgi:transcriptional repressor NrdR